MALRPHYRIITHTLCLCILLLPSIVFGAGTAAEQAAAKNFVPLVGIPYIEGNKVATFGDYVNALYIASISIAAFLAVVKIIFAGVKYMLTDIVSTKGDAKKEIRSALIGLLIVVGAVLILETINPNLRQINLFANAPVPGVELTKVKTPAVLSDLDKACAKYGKDNCSIQSCDILASKNFVGWFLKDPVNRTGCSARCLYYGGTIVNRTYLNTGDCAYPTDRLKAIEQEIANTPPVKIVNLDGSTNQPDLQDFKTECTTQDGTYEQYPTFARCTYPTGHKPDNSTQPTLDQEIATARKSNYSVYDDTNKPIYCNTKSSDFRECRKKCSDLGGNFTPADQRCGFIN